MKYTYLFILIFFSNFLMASTAKDDCSILKGQFTKAERSYDDGDLFGAIDLLEKSTIDKFTRKCPETRQKVYALLAKLYLLTNEDEKAIENNEKVLKINPSYKPNEVLEPTDFVFFADKYRAVPRWSITPEIHVVNTWAISGIGEIKLRSVEAIQLINKENKNLQAKYTSDLSYGTGIRGSFFPTRHLEFSVGYGRNINKFTIKKEYTRDTETFSSNELITISEVELWNNFSGMLKYNMGKRGFVFNVFTGIEVNRLEQAYFTKATRGDFDLIEALRTNNREKLTKSGSLDVMKLRSEKNDSVFLGFGFKYRPSKRLNRNFIELGFKSAFFRRNINSTINEGPLSESLRRDLIFALGYMDDQMRVRYTQISIGYSYTFYDTIKTKKRFSFGF